MNSRGMTYTGVLLAAALFSAAAAPVLAGFVNASQNQRYAREAYEASLYAANLLAEAGGGPPAPSGDFAELLGNTAFDGEYREDIYDYRLCVYEYADGGLELKFSQSSPGLDAPEAPVPVLSGYVIPPPPPAGARADVAAADGICDVSLSEDTDIFVSGGEDLEIGCESTAPSPVTANIYAPDPSKITVSCDNAGAGLSVFIAEAEPAGSERVISAEVYNRKGELINTLAAPAVYWGAEE